MVYSVWIAEVTHYDSVEERLLIFVGLDVLANQVVPRHRGASESALVDAVVAQCHRNP